MMQLINPAPASGQSDGGRQAPTDGGAKGDDAEASTFFELITANAVVSGPTAVSATASALQNKGSQDNVIPAPAPLQRKGDVVPGLRSTEFKEEATVARSFYATDSKPLALIAEKGASASDQDDIPPPSDTSNWEDVQSFSPVAGNTPLPANDVGQAIAQDDPPPSSVSDNALEQETLLMPRRSSPLIATDARQAPLVEEAPVGSQVVEGVTEAETGGGETDKAARPIPSFEKSQSAAVTPDQDAALPSRSERQSQVGQEVGASDDPKNFSIPIEKSASLLVPSKVDEQPAGFLGEQAKMTSASPIQNIAVGEREALQSQIDGEPRPTREGGATPSPVSVPSASATPTASPTQLAVASPAAFEVNQVHDARAGLPERLSEVPLLGTESRADSVTLDRARPEPAAARAIVSQVVQSVIRAPGDGVFEIRLQPEELGRVRLSLTPVEAGLSVQITAERAETLDLLRRNIDLLENDLQEQGFQDLAFSFGADEFGLRQDQTDTESNETNSAEIKMAQHLEVELPRGYQARSAERLDIRV